MVGVEMTREDFFEFWKKVVEATTLEIITGQHYQRYAIKNDILLVSANSRIYSDTDSYGYSVKLDRSLVHLLPHEAQELQNPKR